MSRNNVNASPFINGRKNENFIPPHLKSQVNIGLNEQTYEKALEKRNRIASMDTTLSRANKKTSINENDEDLICNHCLNKSVVNLKSTKKKPSQIENSNGDIREKHVFTIYY